MSAEFTLVLDAQYALGESPVWRSEGLRSLRLPADAEQLRDADQPVSISPFGNPSVRLLGPERG